MATHCQYSVTPILNESVRFKKMRNDQLSLPEERNQARADQPDRVASVHYLAGRRIIVCGVWHSWVGTAVMASLLSAQFMPVPPHCAAARIARFLRYVHQAGTRQPQGGVQRTDTITYESKRRYRIEARHRG